MSDKYNDFNDDFFEQFDKPTESKTKKASNDKYTDVGFDDDDFFFGGAKDYRSASSKSSSAASRSTKSKKANANDDFDIFDELAAHPGTDTSKKKHSGSGRVPKDSSDISKSASRAKRQRKNEKLAAKEQSFVKKAQKVRDKALDSTASAVAATSKFGGSASGASSKKSRKPESKVGALFRTIVLIGLMGVFAIGIYVGLVFLKAPAIDTDDIYSQISQRSVMYDSNGKEVESLYFTEGNRTIIKYDQIPESMVDAVVAIEDQKFWTHNGFNFIRMVGAVKDSIFGGGDISGTSTVTQQLARNVYLSDIKSQRSLSRKLNEMYCTIVLEKNLSKKQIMEAYLNTIYLGFNSYGVEAAAESYFNTDAKHLNLEQCAALAALPSSPDVYALVYSDYYNTYTDLPKIKKTDSVTYLYNGDLTKERRELVLDNMEAKGFISSRECADAKSADLQSEIKIGSSADADKVSYFTDYAIDKLVADIQEEYNLSEADAENMIYTKGLKIYTTMDSNVQGIMEEEFADDNNFTSVAYSRTNDDGNIISDKGVVLAYKYGWYFNDNGDFVLKKSDYRKNSDGSLTIYKGKRLNLYSTEIETGTDISIQLKGMFKKGDDGKFYFIESGTLSIPSDYKSLDDNGNCIISAQFFEDYPDFFKKSNDDENAGYIVDNDNVALKQKVRQPQAAAVIIENKTGEVKGMMGGRGATGKQLYNRAVNPRQPGSSIKPIAIYGPAIQMSYEYHEANKTLNLDTSEGSDWGKYVTAGSVINDAKTTDGNGKTWPYNDDHSYHGDQTMREALQQSLNVCSYKIYKQIDANVGSDYCIDMLKKSGITTVNKADDSNPAAMSLGGLTRGLTPLEETAAYSVFPNGGVYKTPIFYTKIVDSNGNVIFEKKAEETQVYDPGVAWIMTDMLRSVVTSGLGRSASISSQPAAGKTGTTSNMYDIWFSGFTPQYSMALWMGNDINMSVSNYSYKAAGFWGAIMGRVCEDIPQGSYFAQPSNVTRVAGEYYTTGTYSKVSKKKSKESKTTTETTTLPTTIVTTPIASPTTDTTTTTTSTNAAP